MVLFCYVKVVSWQERLGLRWLWVEVRSILELEISLYLKDFALMFSEVDSSMIKQCLSDLLKRLFAPLEQCLLVAKLQSILCSESLMAYSVPFLNLAGLFPRDQVLLLTYSSSVYCLRFQSIFAGRPSQFMLGPTSTSSRPVWHSSFLLWAPH